MIRFLIKTLISALIIATVSELSKKENLLAAILASLPLTSLLAMIWLYNDTKDPVKVANLSTGILWAIIPSLVFFLIFPYLIKTGLNFWLSMVVGLLAMGAGYVLYSYLAK